MVGFFESESYQRVNSHFFFCGGRTKLQKSLSIITFGPSSGPRTHLHVPTTRWSALVAATKSPSLKQRKAFNASFIWTTTWSQAPQSKKPVTSKEAKDLVTLLAKDGFVLTKFVSNINYLPAELQHWGVSATSDEKLIPKPDESSHVLVLKWIHASDTPVVSRGMSPGTNKTMTQREVLSLVSTVYDPTGLVPPYTVDARLLLKDTWRLSGQHWDDDLSD